MKKLLALCDSPTVFTGFGNVSRNLLSRWRKHFDAIDVWGINFSGWPHNFPYKIFPAGYQDWTTARKLQQFLNLLGTAESGYTHLWILQDCNQLSGGNVPEFLRKVADFRGIEVTFYYPVDATLEKEWLSCVEVCDHAVTYSNYGLSETARVAPHILPHILPHGVDTTVYRPLDNRMQLRHEGPAILKKLGGWVRDDDFLILNVNRNERRKAPHHSLQILQQLLKIGVKAKLVMHCPNEALGEGTFLETVGRQLGLPHGEHWMHNEAAFVNYHGLFDESHLNELYNCADLVLNTAGGEGWGLALSEGVSAGCRVAAPDHTGCGEMIRRIKALGNSNTAFALPVSQQCQVNAMDNSRVRYPVDVFGAAKMIAGIADISKTEPRATMNAAVKHWLNWDRIADEFIQIMLHTPSERLRLPDSQVKQASQA